MANELRHTNCACVNIRRANRAICHLYDLVLGPTQLKATQFTILQTIDESGEIAHCDLAIQIAASVETLSRRLANARKCGWVRMQIGRNGRRIYALTPKGNRVLQEALPYWERAQLRLRQTLGENDWHLLASFTERLTSAAIRAEGMRCSNGGAKPAIVPAFLRTLPHEDSETGT
jgi:DNA-binding MarR family transcriptional regulator